MNTNPMGEMRSQYRFSCVKEFGHGNEAHIGRKRGSEAGRHLIHVRTGRTRMSPKAGSWRTDAGGQHAIGTVTRNHMAIGSKAWTQTKKSHHLRLVTRRQNLHQPVRAQLSGDGAKHGAG